MSAESEDKPTPRYYRVFVRTWWKKNRSWPNGLEPNASRGRTIAHGLTESEARRMCADFNANNDPGRYSRKAEYTAE